MLEVLLTLTQRKTQTPTYWQEQFTVSSQDIEFVYNQVLEENRLFDLDNIAIAIVSRQCHAEELKARTELHQGKLYQPKETFAVGEQVIFPALDFALGTIQYDRPGHHPEYGDITVMGVSFDGEATPREFVANFDFPHALNVDEAQSLATFQGLLAPEELYETYKEFILPKVRAALHGSHDFVEFHDQYFLRDLLLDFHEGLFNIADAAIDINNGPLSADALVEQMGLAEQGITDVMRFSVNYRLDQDERFDDVGPTGQVLWYLERLEPPEVHHPPRRLQPAGSQSYDPALFGEDLRALLAEIDDEVTDPADIPPLDPDVESITLVLNYPHRRVGTLPLTPKTLPFFPTSRYNPVRFDFVDRRSGSTFPGWTVLNHNYVFGLDEWYNKNKLPVGAYITLKRTDNPMRVIIDYPSVRTQRDWVRTATVTGNRLGFQMNKEPISGKYDELMIIAEANSAEIDQVWINMQARDNSLYELLRHLFPELSKLNPQSTVHAKTLYSAVNVVYRTSPGVVFQALVTHDSFVFMKNGYWIFDPSIRD